MRYHKQVRSGKMRKVALMLLAVAVAYMLAVNVASAQEKAKKPKASAEEQFTKMDTNKDGKVTMDEFAAAHPRAKDKARLQAEFKKIAKDKDSFTLDDFKAYLKAKEEKRAKKEQEKKTT
jgi:hypothetical protein